MKFNKLMLSNLSTVLLNAASLIIFQSIVQYMAVYNFKCLDPFGQGSLNGLTRDDSPSLAATTCSMLRTTTTRCYESFIRHDQMTFFNNATLHFYVCVHRELMLLVLLHLLLL